MDIPATSTTLLRDIAQDSNNARWGEFVSRYRPMMEAFLRERFPAFEADDIIQETFLALCKILPDYQYSPDEKGHFHNYLTGILRNKALRVIRKEQRQKDITAELRRVEDNAPYHYDADGRACRPATADGRAACPQAAADEQSYRESIFEIALRQFLADKTVADRTKRIFERTAINGESPEAVAESFKMTRHAVDQAKSRAMARLRELAKKLEDAANG